VSEQRDKPAGAQPDPRAVQRAFERAATGYDAAAGLQRETADELLERLAGIRIDPARIVDLGCGTGYATQALQRMYRRARVLGIDFAPAMVRHMRAGRRLGRRPLAACADVTRLPLADASVDLAFSNLTFQWLADPVRLFGEIRRVLRPHGVLMFSTFGPDTLSELRTAWATVDHDVHVTPFADMHDIGDALLGAGLVDPVMDAEQLQRSYPDLRALMRALKALGAQNAAHGRKRGLTGKGTLARLEQAYPRVDTAGRPIATWELAYGHAWGNPIPRPGAGTAREFHVPVESIARRGTKGGD